MGALETSKNGVTGVSSRDAMFRTYFEKVAPLHTPREIKPETIRERINRKLHPLPTIREQINAKMAENAPKKDEVAASGQKAKTIRQMINERLGKANVVERTGIQSEDEIMEVAGMLNQLAGLDAGQEGNTSDGRAKKTDVVAVPENNENGVELSEEEAEMELSLLGSKLNSKPPRKSIAPEKNSEDETLDIDSEQEPESISAEELSMMENIETALMREEDEVGAKQMQIPAATTTETQEENSQVEEQEEKAEAPKQQKKIGRFRSAMKGLIWGTVLGSALGLGAWGVRGLEQQYMAKQTEVVEERATPEANAAMGAILGGAIGLIYGTAKGGRKKKEEKSAENQNAPVIDSTPENEQLRMAEEFLQNYKHGKNDDIVTQNMQMQANLTQEQGEILAAVTQKIVNAMNVGKEPELSEQELEFIDHYQKAENAMRGKYSDVERGIRRGETPQYVVENSEYAFGSNGTDVGEAKAILGDIKRVEVVVIANNLHLAGKPNDAQSVYNVVAEGDMRLPYAGIEEVDAILKQAGEQASA